MSRYARDPVSGSILPIAGGGGSGGHTIVNEAGTTYPARAKLQFNGAIVSDDETNDATVVETVNPVDYEEDIYGVNLIPYPYKDAPPKTSYGVTFTAGSNGAIVANGTNDGTRTSEYHFIRILGSELKSLMKNQPCILSGCPSGGTLESYRLDFSCTDSWTTVKTDTGEGVTILPSDIEDSVQYIIRIIITRNYTVPTNLTFKPMLRKATIQDDTYRPYNQQSIQNQITDQTNVLGAKNLLPNTAITQTQSGVTFTVNNDGSVTANGTATANITTYFIYTELYLKPGRYICSGNPLGFDDIYTGLRISDPNYSIVNAFFKQGYVLTVNESISNTRLRVDIRVASGVTLNNAVFKPMLRLASDPDDTYVPYAMTNRELTERMIDTGWIDVTANAVNLASGAIWYRVKSGMCMISCNAIVPTDVTAKISVSNMPKAVHFAGAALFFGGLFVADCYLANGSTTFVIERVSSQTGKASGSLTYICD